MKFEEGEKKIMIKKELTSKRISFFHVFFDNSSPHPTAIVNEESKRLFGLSLKNAF